MWFGSKKQNEIPITFPDYRHKSAHPQGGFNLSLGEENTETQKVAASVFKQLGAKILSGNFSQWSQISKPIAMSMDISFLHGIAIANTYINILEKSNGLSPLEQLKNICAYYISGLHCNGEVTKLKSPLDPLIGETLQLIKDDGIQFYAEQISTNPPISCYMIKGNNFQIYGSDILDITVHKTINSLSGVQLGKQTIEFKDGQIYKCVQRPSMEITGLVMGDRIMNFQGKMIIEGQNLKAIIYFNYNPEGMISKLTSFFKSQEQIIKVYDVIEVDIYEIKINEEGKQEEQLIQQGVGSWLEGISFGEQNFWKIDEKKENWKSPQEILESDSTKRTDLILMQEQKMEDAQQAKLNLEEQNFKDIEARKKPK